MEEMPVEAISCFQDTKRRKETLVYFVDAAMSSKRAVSGAVGVVCVGAIMYLMRPVHHPHTSLAMVCAAV